MSQSNKGGRTAQPDQLDRSSEQSLASLMDGWKEWLKQRNYRDTSIELNLRTTRLFITWAEERDLRTAEQITRPILESYQRYLYRLKKKDGMPLAVSTQRQRVHILQKFFAYLSRGNFILANPASDLELPRRNHNKLPKGLSVYEVQRLMNIPDVKDPLGVRDRAMLEVFYATGIRRKELSMLDREDVDLSQKTLHVREGKGGKSRLLPIAEKALHWLKKYLEEVRDLLAYDRTEKALFISGYGTRYSHGSLGPWMKKMLREAEIVKPGCCHLLRHSCATHMLENGCDIRLIQQILGHANLETTSLYTEVAISHLQEVYDKTHPSACK